jgi:hypothetical protein
VSSEQRREALLLQISIPRLSMSFSTFRVLTLLMQSYCITESRALPTFLLGSRNEGQ